MRLSSNIKSFLFLFFSLSFSLPFSFGASLPSSIRHDSLRHQLIQGDQANRGLYDQAIIRNYYLYFDQPNYWHLLDSIYWTWTRADIPATLVVDGVTYPQVGVRFKGQSSFQQIQGYDKKSFDITLDYEIPGQNIMGYKNLNLNNSFQDASFMGEVIYQHLLKKHVPEAMSCYARLFINGQYWGLYPSIEQLNKTFLSEWFLSNDGSFWRCDRPNGGPPGYGDGTGALNYLGPDTNSYKPNYILKSSTVAHPWDNLVHTCDLLNNTPLDSLPTKLPAVLDVDRTLWFLASENLFSDDDSYIEKGRMDYFAYWELETGRMVPQEYDGNTVMNPAYVGWSPFYHEDSVNYPLMNRLFHVPAYRQRYMAHLRTLLEEDFDPDTINQKIQHYSQLIDTLVYNDPKKLYTYADFLQNVQVKKQFMLQKRANLWSHPEVAQVAPGIASVKWIVEGVDWRMPAADEEPIVLVQMAVASDPVKVYLYYATGLVGNFTKIKMFDDGVHRDGLAGDGLFAGVLPAQALGTAVRFYVEAQSATAPFSVRYDPPGAEHNVYYYRVGYTANGIEEREEDGLSIAPIPCRGILNLRAETSGTSMMGVYDMTGQKILERSMDGALELDLSDLANGVYFVRKDKSYHKIVLMH